MEERGRMGLSFARDFFGLGRYAQNFSQDGTFLDIGCGSLAFTAKTYSQYNGRPVILWDQSLKMLRMVKTRLIKQNGKDLDNLVFLHADAL